MNERNWYACAFVTFSAPEMSLTGWRFSLLRTDGFCESRARNEIWRMRTAVESQAWTFWIEPESMDESERQKYIPLVVREALEIVDRNQ